MKAREDLSIVIAGEAGQGIQAIESMLTAFAKRARLHVFATKEYMSRVRGGCNSTEIRLSRRPVSARIGRVDILVALNSSAVAHLGSRIDAETLVIGDKNLIGHESMLDIPFASIAAGMGGAIYANAVAVGALCSLLGMDRASSEGGLRDFFAKKGAAVVEANLAAFSRGYERGDAVLPRLPIELGADPAVAEEIMVTGAEAVAFGAAAAGCDFVCAYPMSPGTSVLTAMAGMSERLGILVEQVEDEIGAANMALGAWYAGARALVTTSGGGFDLMGEAVSLSGAIETPMVVHIAQRPGPATGLPTRTEQGDLNLAIHAGHGDFPRVVLAPGDLEEGFSLAGLAFEIADRYQSPVFILTDQYYVDSYYTTPSFAPPPAGPARAIVETRKDYLRYALGSPDGISPRGIPGFGEGLVRVDSDEHDEGGYITEDPAMRVSMVEKRLSKAAALRRDILPPRLHGSDNYDILLVGWGSVKMPIQEALAVLDRAEIAYLHFPWVYPLPPRAGEYMAKAKLVIAIEGNATGQFADLLEFETGIRIAQRMLKYDGSQYSVEELVGRISALAPRKE